MPAAIYEIAIDQGATFRFSTTLNSSDGATPPTLTPIPLTGCTAQMMIRAAYPAARVVAPAPPITLTTENGGITLAATAVNSIVLYLTPAQTLSLPVVVPAGFSPLNGPPTALYVADLDITVLSGDIYRYANFLITVNGTVTR